MTDNWFLSFGVDHLSPNSLNTWGSNPALWLVRYGMNLKGGVVPKMALGSCVERGLQGWLEHGDAEMAQRDAETVYDGEMLDVGDHPDKAKCRDLIAPMLEQAKLAMGMIGAGIPKLYQNRVEAEIKGVPVPCMGYTDFEWDEILVDLKTTSRMPSKPKPEHVRQVAFYQRATGKSPALLYVTPKAHNVYAPTEQELNWAWDELSYYARSLQAALTGGASLEQLLARYPADFADFRWDDETREAAKTALRKAEVL